MKKLQIALLTMSTMLAAAPALATVATVVGTTLKIMASSTTFGGTANLITSSVGIWNQQQPHPYCGNKLYIDSLDKDLYAAALSFSTTSTAVNVIFDDSAPARNIPGHNSAFTCKVLSIYQP